MEFDRIQEIYDKPENRALTLQSARESLVLFKNEDVLPIRKDMRKIAVIGCHANNARAFFGGYTHMDMMTSWLAASSSMARVEQSDKSSRPENIILPGSQVQDDEQKGFDAVLKQQKPDCRNLVQELTERLGDVEIVYAYGYPKYGTDTSHFTEVLDVAKDADLILMTLGGKWGSGTTQVRSIGFTNYVDGSHAPRYYFGEGLSYTSYRYSNPVVHKREVNPDEPVEISLDVANTGSVDGTEIVYLFIWDEYASMTRANMELQGFARVPLKAGEKKQVTFRLDPSQTAFLTRKREIEWKIEKGEFKVMVRSAANRILLEDCFVVTEDSFIKSRERAFYCLGEVL